MKSFTDEELKDEFNLPKNTLPLNVFLGELIGFENDNVHINFLTPKYKPNDGYLNEERVWPNKVDHHWINKKCVMELCPSLKVDMKLSTRRMVVYEITNLALINRFIELSMFIVLF